MVARIKRVARAGVRRPRRAVWLSPILLSTALLQTVDCEAGKSLKLATLAIDVSGDDQIEDFLPTTWVYRVATRGESMVVRTEAGVIGIGGGEVTIAV